MGRNTAMWYDFLVRGNVPSRWTAKPALAGLQSSGNVFRHCLLVRVAPTARGEVPQASERSCSLGSEPTSCLRLSTTFSLSNRRTTELKISPGVLTHGCVASINYALVVTLGLEFLVLIVCVIFRDFTYTAVAAIWSSVIVL